LMVFLRYLGFKIISCANTDNLISSFTILIPFISFLCHISLARNSTTIQNKSGKNGHPCLFPDFRGNAFQFSPLIECWL
jgi:hypothetical protein